MKKPKQSTKPITRDETARPALKLSVPASAEAIEANAALSNAVNGTPAGSQQAQADKKSKEIITTVRFRDEFRLFDPDAQIKETRGGSVAIPTIKLKPDIHQEPGSADRKIDVTPDEFPLKRYDPLRKVIQTDESTLHVANDLLVGTTVLVRTGRKVLDEEEKTNFISQVASAKRLSHNGVLPILDAGITSGGNAFVVSEYITGMTFKRYLEENAPVDDLVIINVFLDLCNTIESQAVVLNDLSLDGIILAPSIFGTTTVKLNAFGVEFARSEPLWFGDKKQKVGIPLDPNTYDTTENAPARNDVVALGRCLREAFKINQQPHRKKLSGGPVQLAGMWLKEAPEPQNEEIEKLLNRTSSNLPGEWFDSIRTIKHELQALKELLTYSNSGPGANHTQIAFDKKAIRSLVGVILPVMLLLTVVLVSTTRPLQMPSISDGLRSQDPFGQLLLPQVAAQDDELPGEHIQLYGPEIIIEGSDLTYAKLQKTLTHFRQAFSQTPTVYNISSPVVDSSDDVFSGEIQPPYNVNDYHSRQMSPPGDQSITSFTLKNSSINADTLEALARESQLQTIIFENCTGITPSAMDGLARLQNRGNLLSISFLNTDARGASFSSLKNLRFLHSIQIDNKLEDSDLKYIAQIRAKVITIRNTAITTEGLKALTYSKSLIGLNLHKNRNIKLTRMQLRKMFPDCTIGLDEY